MKPVDFITLYYLDVTLLLFSGMQQVFENTPAETITRHLCFFRKLSTFTSSFVKTRHVQCLYVCDI